MRISVRTLVALAFLLAVNATSVAQTIWRMDVDGADVARSLDINVYRFRYEIPEGKYNIDCWLERMDEGSTTPKRLTTGRAANAQIITGGSVILSLIENDSPVGRGDGSIRGMIYREDRGAGQTSVTRIPVETQDVLKDLRTVTTSVSDERHFKIGEAIPVLTIGGGETSSVTGDPEKDVATNKRLLVFRIRFTESPSEPAKP